MAAAAAPAVAAVAHVVVVRAAARGGARRVRAQRQLRVTGRRHEHRAPLVVALGQRRLR